MKVFLCILAVLALPVAADAQKKKPAEPTVTVRPSNDALRKTVEHLQRHARTIQEENDGLKVDLLAAKNDLTGALAKADTLQVEVNKVTDDRNQQAKEKDLALDDRDKWKAKHEEARKKLNWWRAMAAGITTLGLLYVFVPMILKAVKPSI